MAFPWSLAGYFALGVLGALAFLAGMLLVDKDLDLLRNNVIDGVGTMALVYVAAGGLVSAVVNVTSNPDLGAGQFLVGFGAGASWPAIVAGLGAGKNVSDVKAQARQHLETAIESKSRQLEAVTRRLEQLET